MSNEENIVVWMNNLETFTKLITYEFMTSSLVSEALDNDLHQVIYMTLYLIKPSS